MLYYLFDFLDKEFDLLGAGVFKYISFRAGMSVLVSLLITIAFGKHLIPYLKRKQVEEEVRNLGLKDQMKKKGTPTMGGVIIIMAVLIPTLLFAKIQNVYIILLIFTTIGLGAIGFLDDYIKVFKKHKEGLKGKFKIIGQVLIGLTVGFVLYFSEGTVIRVKDSQHVAEYIPNQAPQKEKYVDIKSTKTTIPFVKHNEFDYRLVMPRFLEDYTWVLYIFVVIFIITAVSNGANITDGIDGLAAGSSAIIGLTLAIFAYLSGNAIFSDYLNIMYIPNSGELVIYCAAFTGACIGFLWYNAFPAQVFMGDTGSLSLGGIIAVLALCIRKELLIPFICGVFLIENVSVLIQVAYFKYTKKKSGKGQRIFKMAPLHHHYQKLGIPEPKIVTRFWIIGVLLSILALATLKLR